MRDTLIPARFLSETRRDVVSESERQVLGLIARQGGQTQADLTQALPLSQQSISRMCSALEARGILMRSGRRQSGRRGQPSVEMALNPGFAVSLGISLMADGIRLCLLDLTGTVIASLTPQLADLQQDTVLRAVVRGRDHLLGRAKLTPDSLIGVGLATSGFRVGPGAVFNTPPSLGAFALTDLEALFSNALALPVWAENDGKAATLAENMSGVGRSVRNFAYLFIATGVGGGVVMNGRLVTGARGNAGEFVGALPIPDYPFPNLERLRVLLNEDGHEFETVSALLEAFDPDWPAIERWIDQVTPSLSLIASAASAILDTEALVLGGRLPQSLADRLAPRLQFYDIARRDVRRAHAEVIAARCDTDPTATGAAWLPFADLLFGLI